MSYRILAVLILLFASACPNVQAIDVLNVLPAALDQPKIYFALEQNGQVLGGNSFAIEGFYDTGASGVVISKEASGQLGISLQTSGGTNVVFSDIGIGGEEPFYVSDPLTIRLADHRPGNLSAPISQFDTQFGSLRTQVGIEPQTNPLLPPLNVIGMPAMAGKVVVMDPRPADSLDILAPDPMRTFVYDPGTPYRPNSVATDPGIPRTSHQIALSYVDFERFTRMTPTTASFPEIRHNPFIGPNPVLALDDPNATDDTPGVTVEFGNSQTTGSFLLDTGASASFISSEIAAGVNVRYRAGTENTAAPILETTSGQTVSDQFTLTIGGVGGERTVAGFFLDNMLVRTLQGDATDDSDPRHFNIDRAPVLVTDIGLEDPVTGQSITLDGVFGVNNFVASLSFIDFFGLPFPDRLEQGNFDWAVFDEPNGVLGLTPKNLPGDTDGDGFWTCQDIAGMNRSQVEDWLFTSATKPGDANLDGAVDAADLAIWDNNQFVSGTEWCSADFNLDGHTDVRDFNVWLENRSPSAIGAAVPEPSSFALLVCLVVLSSLCRQRG